jgi:uncharacterized membrane protein YedE/YeeE
MNRLIYLLLGTLFGIVLAQAEVLSWWRIQEMFRFQSPRMYLIIASALGTAALGLRLVKRKGLAPPPKQMGRGIRYLVGGATFGLGWALVGACPGPLFALLGLGMGVMVVAIASALAGTWLYGYLRPRLPH